MLAGGYDNKRQDKVKVKYFDGRNLSLAVFLESVEQNVSKAIKHASIGVKHHQVLAGTENEVEAKAFAEILVKEGGVVADNWDGWRTNTRSQELTSMTAMQDKMEEGATKEV